MDIYFLYLLLKNMIIGILLVSEEETEGGRYEKNILT